MYHQIFCKNLRKEMAKRDINASELSSLSGVSNSYLSDLFHQKGNPSIKTMQSISEALNIPLPKMLQQKPEKESLPKGYERVNVILPEMKAYQVNRWHKEASKALKLGSNSL